MNVKFGINIGEYEVLASGVVITHLDKGIQFHIEGLTYNIQFKKDETTDKASINATVSPNDIKQLDIELVNYDNSLGQGLINPVEVGSINDKILFLHFMVSKLNTTDTRIFEYTWLGKEKGGNEDE